MTTATRQPDSRARPADRSESAGEHEPVPATHAAPAPDTAAGSQEPFRQRVFEQLKTAAGFIAPTTLITAVLAWYGYVSTYQEYLHFGIHLSMLRMSTADLAIQSIAALWVPCLVTLAAVGVVHEVTVRVNRLLADAANRERLHRGATIALRTGIAMTVFGAISVWPFGQLSENERLAGLTPFCLGAGTALAAYAVLVRRRAPWAGDDACARVRMIGPWPWLIAGFVVLNLFWGAGSFAAAYGAGRGEWAVKKLTDSPAVILDTTERLYLNSACAVQTDLPAEEGQRFRYRYRGLHLLTSSGGRLFLVPAAWSKGCPVLVLPDDEAVRLQFS